jgi:hypothetical protein
MSRISLVRLAPLLTVFSALAIAQTDTETTPTIEGIARLRGQGEGYIRLIVRALIWKAPATKVCTEMRAMVESMAEPPPGGDKLIKPPDPRFLLEFAQQSEEDEMRRLARFSSSIYDSIRQGCLAVPPPPARKKQ